VKKEKKAFSHRATKSTKTHKEEKPLRAPSSASCLRVKRKERKASSHKATKSTNLPVGRQGLTKKKENVVNLFIKELIKKNKMQFPKITSVEAIAKYKLKLRFVDGTQGEYEISDLAAQGVFKIWEIDDNFFKVFVNKESGAISWPGDIEIDTLNAYCTIKGISPEAYFQNQWACHPLPI